MMLFICEQRMQQWIDVIDEDQAHFDRLKWEFGNQPTTTILKLFSTVSPFLLWVFCRQIRNRNRSPAAVDERRDRETVQSDVG